MLTTTKFAVLLFHKRENRAARVPTGKPKLIICEMLFWFVDGSGEYKREKRAVFQLIFDSFWTSSTKWRRLKFHFSNVKWLLLLLWFVLIFFFFKWNVFGMKLGLRTIFHEKFKFARQLFFELTLLNFLHKFDLWNNLQQKKNGQSELWIYSHVKSIVLN